MKFSFMGFNVDLFVEQVEEMRQLQKDYFRSRHPLVLRQCKRKEQDVDRMIKAYRIKDDSGQASLV